MKKIMILGAGIYQLPLIKKAKEMGLYTIAASYPGPYPGLSIADQIYHIDTTDRNRLLEAARHEKVDGVCTSGTDVAVRSLGFLCDTLRLPGISGDAAAILTDKARMKEAFLQANVSAPASLCVSSLAETIKAFESLGSPAMVKAVDSSGSRGITKITSLSELEQAYHKSMQITKKDYLLVEEFVDAHEIGVDGFVSDGELKFLLPHDKFVLTAMGTTLPAGHRFPFSCKDSLKAEIRRQMELVVQASGMDHCALNADILIRDDKVYVLEAGGRAGATCIPELISSHCGFDYYEQIIRNSLGMSVDFTQKTSVPCMARLLFSNKSGILTHIDYAFLERLRHGGILASIDYSIGNMVTAVQNATDRIGQILMKTDREQELDEICRQLMAHIKIDGMTLDALWNK